MKNFKNATSVNRKRASLLASFTLCALAVGSTISTGLAQGQSPNRATEFAAPLEGSWIFAVARTQDMAASFTSVASFTAGGVFIATGSNDRVNPVSALHGSWRRIGKERFSSTTYFFAFDPAKPNGPAVGMLKTNQVFQLTNRDELIGSGDLSSCDLSGGNCVVISAGSIRISGRRIVPEVSLGLVQSLPPE